MSTERNAFPIRSADSSLASQLQALDALSHRLCTLTTRTRWPAQIPINSKASISGLITHTNELKVDIGAGYWVEMTASEAQAYVQRRKTGEPSSRIRLGVSAEAPALLLRHAGLKENAGSPKEGAPLTQYSGAVEVSFSPMFAIPAAAGPSRSPRPPAEQRRTETTGGQAAVPLSASVIHADANTSRTLNDPPSNPAPASLEDVVDRFLQMQGIADDDNQRAKRQGGLADDAVSRAIYAHKVPTISSSTKRDYRYGRSERTSMAISSATLLNQRLTATSPRSDQMTIGPTKPRLVARLHLPRCSVAMTAISTFRTTKRQRQETNLHRQLSTHRRVLPHRRLGNHPPRTPQRLQNRS
jgi:hypothetical protein